MYLSKSNRIRNTEPKKMPKRKLPNTPPISLKCQYGKDYINAQDSISKK